jgi:hypothetical protein
MALLPAFGYNPPAPMNTAKTRLASTETQKIKAGLEQCIRTLDHNRHLLGEAELQMRQQLVQLHSEIEKLDIDSRPPFAQDN